METAGSCRGLDGSRFTAGGGPVDSMPALFSYLSTGVPNDRHRGMKNPAVWQARYSRISNSIAAGVQRQLFGKC
jgi:hypothetical protein